MKNNVGESYIPETLPYGCFILPLPSVPKGNVPAPTTLAVPGRLGTEQSREDLVSGRLSWVVRGSEVTFARPLAQLVCTASPS